MTEDGRPDPHEYYMGIAFAVRARAVCLKRKVAAVLVKDGRIISTGYNGTPDGMPNCDAAEEGCLRCRESEQFPPGSGYDVCICVHAEQNAMLAAARFGISIEGATLYTTVRPCFGCTKEALQAKVETIYYLHDWRHPSDDVRAEYDRLQARIPGGVRPVPGGLTDPDEPEPGAEPLADTGHEPQGVETTSG